MKAFSMALSALVLTGFLSGCGSGNSSPLISYGLNGGASSTTNSWGTRQVYPVLSGYATAGSNRVLNLSYSSVQVNDVIYASIYSGGMSPVVYGSTGGFISFGTSAPLTSLSITLNGNPIAVNPYGGSFTAQSSGTLSVSFDSALGSTFSNYQVSFPYGSGISIGRCLNPSGQSMACPQ